MKKSDIKLVTQGDKDCVLACLAMVSGKTLQEIHDIFPEFNGLGVDLQTEMIISSKLGLIFISQFTPMLLPGRVYLVTVPSLSTKGGTHRIVIIYNVDGTIKILDPNEGRGDREVYTEETLKSWGEVIEIWFED